MTDDPEVIEIKPPQVLREQVRREHDAALAPRSPFGGLPTDVDRAQLAELLKPETLRRNADSLPVLAAFQEFLDVERRRTRGRMLALTALFLVMLLVVGGVAGLLGLTYFRRTHEQTQALQAGLHELRSQIGTGYDGAFSALSNLASRASVIETTFDKEMATLAIEQDGLSVQLSGMNTNLAGLYGTITTLRAENAQLSDRMERRAAEWQLMTSQVDQVVALLARAPASARPVAGVHPSSPGSPSPAVTLSPAPPARENLILAIIPKNKAHAVEWRIPLPATQE